MRPARTRRAALPALLLSVALWSCDTADAPVVGPGAGPAYSTTSSPYVAILGKDGDSGLAAAVIGAEGGSLKIGEHALTIPAGAVGEPTIFSIAVTDPDHIKVFLTAIQISSTGQVVNVGKTGFAKPVQLTLSYSTATETVDEGKLLIVWARDDGTLEAMPSAVDAAAKRVRADLGHFSGYTVVIPRDGSGTPTCQTEPC